MIEVFKIVKGFDVVNAGSTFLELEAGPLRGRTRGHPLKLIKPRHKTLKRNMHFAYGVVKRWNSLPENVVTSSSVNTFKNRYDEHMTKQ